MVSALVLLGFDIGHAVITLFNFKPSVVTVVVPLVEGSSDSRAVAAYSHLEQIAISARIKCSRLEVEVTRVYTC